MALLQRVRQPFRQDLPDDEPLSPLGPRSAGDLLRQRREALGLDLGTIAAALKIKPAYLAALEAGRPDRLPGPTYAAGFVRAYGSHLGLDGDEILRRFKQESSELSVKPDLSFPMPLGERSIPGGKMLLVAMILAFCGYGTWYYWATDQRSRPERVTEVPVALLPPKIEPNPAGRAGARPPEAAAEIRVTAPGNGAAPDTAPPEPGAAGTASGVPEASPPEPLVALAQPSPAAAPTVPSSQGAGPAAAAPQGETSHAYGVVDGPARIVIRATADSWIQVRGADQSVLFTRVLKIGESYRVPDQPGMSMRTGNAGGLEITVDGKQAPSIGPNGAVRNVPLDPQALISGTAVRG